MQHSLLCLMGVTAKDNQTILEEHAHLIVKKICNLKCVLCISMIMHQYTQQDWMGWWTWKWSWTFPTPSTVSHQIYIFLSHFGVFWRSKSEYIFFHQHHRDVATVLEKEWLKIPMDIVNDLYMSFIPNVNWCCIGRKRRP